jgi:hypothetical protein
MAEIVDPTVPVVKNMLLLDSEGKRIAVKYYGSDWYACLIFTFDRYYYSSRLVYRAFLEFLSTLECRPTVNAQASYEKTVFAKTNRTLARGEGEHDYRIKESIWWLLSPCLDSLCLCAAEITMFDDVIVVYKFIGDLMFFVTGSQDDNELILCQVLQAFYESISLLLR